MPPAAHSGAGDVALFGAIPTAFSGVPAKATPAASLEIARTSAGHGKPEMHGESEPADATASSLHIMHDVVAGPPSGGDGALTLHPPVLTATSGAASASPQAGEPAAPAATGHIATFVPSVTPHPIGDAILHSGAVTLAAPIDSHTPAATVTTAPVAIDDAVATIRVTAAALHDAISTLADRLQTGGEAPSAGGAVSAVEADLQDVQQQIGAAVGHIDALGAAVADQAETCIAQVTHATADVVQTATAGVSHAIDQASGLVDHAGEAIATAAQGVSTALDTLTPTDHLDGLAGNDLIGGVATLVSMVSAADAFSLHDTGVAPDLAPAMGALGSADFLAEVAPSQALLGIHDHHADTGSSMTDHLHDGLFDHG